MYVRVIARQSSDIFGTLQCSGNNKKLNIHKSQQQTFLYCYVYARIGLLYCIFVAYFILCNSNVQSLIKLYDWLLKE